MVRRTTQQGLWRPTGQRHSDQGLQWVQVLGLWGMGPLGQGPAEDGPWWGLWTGLGARPMGVQQSQREEGQV